MQPTTLRNFLIIFIFANVAALPSLCLADTIHLKNGRAIQADSVREVNGRVEYTVGENTFALPKSVVVSIDTGGAPAVASREDIPALPPPSELHIANAEQLDSQVVVNGKVNEDFLDSLSQGDKETAAYAYSLAAQHEETYGSLDKAAGFFDRANSLMPDNAVILANYSSIELRRGHAKQAELLADRATRMDPQMGTAFALLGYADFRLNKTKECVRALKRSLELQPDSNVEALLKKAERELSAESSFTEENSSHFTMRYEGGKASIELRAEILRALETHFDEIARDLDFTPRESISVVLYSDQQYFDVTQAPAWSGALNDGKLRMPISGLTSVTAELSRVLKHELTHSFISQISKGRCPTWFNEGVAQLEEPRSSASDARRLASLYSAHLNIPLNQLETSFLKFSSAEATVAYTQSLFAVEYIRDTYGMSDVAAILRKMGEGQSTETALRSTIHSGYGQFEQELTNYLRKNYGG